MNLRPLLSLSLAASLLALAGCDSQADPSYQGEPLAAVKGQIASDTGVKTGDAVLYWANPSTSPDTIIGVAAPVSASFPASFTLDLYTPPPGGAMVPAQPPSDDRVAIGIVALAQHGASLDGFDDAALLGYCETHVVAYVGSEIDAGGLWEEILHGRPSPGYHLMEVVRPTQAEKDAVQACYDAYSVEFDACYEACSSIVDPAAYEACTNQCDAGYAPPDCGRSKDTFREAPQGFDTTITVTTAPPQGIDWY
jgi:hypothetical protein